MSAVARKRYTIGMTGSEPGSWVDEEPTKSALGRSVAMLAFGLVAALCFAWWAAAPEVRVSATWLQTGRVLSCHYLVGTKVVERQYLLSAGGSAHGVCPLVRFA